MKEEGLVDKAGRLVTEYLAEHKGASDSEACRAVGVTHSQYANFKGRPKRGKFKMKGKPNIQTFDSYIVPEPSETKHVKTEPSNKVIVIISEVSQIASVMKEVWG